MWKINILTLFEEIYPGPFAYSVAKKRQEEGFWSMNVKNIRDYAKDKHRTVDDHPYGGKEGMLLRPDVVGNAIEDFFDLKELPSIVFSPRGEVFNQNLAKEFAGYSGVNILCPRFEGVDERVIKEYNLRALSIGDYVLSSGDIACFVFIDACLRMLPGFFKKEASYKRESFGTELFESLLEYPQYTKPLLWKGKSVPEVLVSGHHREIDEWKLKSSEAETKEKRPDLWQRYLKRCKK